MGYSIGLTKSKNKIKNEYKVLHFFLNNEREMRKCLVRQHII